MQLRLGRHKERGSKLSECSMQRDFPHLQGDKMGKEMPRSGKNKQHEQHNSTSSFFLREQLWQFYMDWLPNGEKMWSKGAPSLVFPH